MPLDVALEVLHVEALHRADLEEDRVRGDDAARLEVMVLDVAPDMHPDFVGGGLRRATYVEAVEEERLPGCYYTVFGLISAGELSK